MVRIITDPSDREGLTVATLVDWVETIAIAPFLFATMMGVVVLATLLRRREPQRLPVPLPGGDGRGEGLTGELCNFTSHPSPVLLLRRSNR